MASIAGRFSPTYDVYVAQLQKSSKTDIEGWLERNTGLLEKVKAGKMDSWRDKVYKSGSIRDRDSLKWRDMRGSVISSDQKKIFMEWLVNKYCVDGMRLFSYIVDVLVTEAMIHFVMDVLCIEYVKAEKVTRLIGAPVTYEEAERYINSRNVKDKSCIQEFSERELEQATDGYKNEVGKGAFGCVYKGSLQHTDVAVKVLDASLMSVVSRDTFVTELHALTKFRHPNLINLMGYCGPKYALIYPYMPNSSLFNALHKSRQPLTWEIRQRILRGTACGIAYLHGSSPPYAHRDIKTQNILLDSDLNPRVADFGFMVEVPLQHGSSCIVSAAGARALAGTRGYLAPEFSAAKLSTKSDIYSYGVVVLETYTRQVAYSEERDDENLVDHLQSHLISSELFTSVADPSVSPPPKGIVEKFRGVAVFCTCRSYKRRPELDETIRKWDGGEEESS